MTQKKQPENDETRRERRKKNFGMTCNFLWCLVCLWCFVKICNTRCLMLMMYFFIYFRVYSSFLFIFQSIFFFLWSRFPWAQQPKDVWQKKKETTREIQSNWMKGNLVIIKRNKVTFCIKKKISKLQCVFFLLTPWIECHFWKFTKMIRVKDSLRASSKGTLEFSLNCYSVWFFIKII